MKNLSYQWTKRMIGEPGGSRRAGATLSEALVALAVMAIGVVCLASMFPIAVLKTARANQLTNSTNIRYNAESMMKVYPWIFADPNPSDDAPTADGKPYNDYASSTSLSPFLFDPQALVPGRPAAMPTAVGFLPRYGGGFSATAAAADAVCAGPDTWSMIHEGSLSAFTASSLTLNDLSTVSSLQWPGANQMRVQIFHNGGKSSLTRMVTQATNGSDTLLISEDLNANSTLDAGEDQNGNLLLDLHALPTTTAFETARLESRERRYTWMLTVRPQGSKTFNVDVVVYFGRQFTPDDEKVFGVPPNNATVTNLVANSKAVLNEGSRTFDISWSTSADVPYLKRGAWILDAQGGYWYQIENFTPIEGVSYSTITLASDVELNSTLVVFPRGIVDVYPIKQQSP